MCSATPHDVFAVVTLSSLMVISQHSLQLGCLPRRSSCPLSPLPLAQLMRKLCTDPGAVLDPSNPSHLEAVQVATGAQDPASALSLCRAIDASPKMVALKDILLQCGIGMDDGDADGVEGGGRAGDTGHRVLVFAQARASLDLVETLVLAPMGVPCVRLDGSMEPTARFAAVRKFREDPTIPVVSMVAPCGLWNVL